MQLFWIIFGVVMGLALLVFITTAICFRITFYVTKKQKKVHEFSIPPGDIYLPYKDKMLFWMKEVKNIPYEEVRIKSFDNLTLYGKYYECKKGAPIELMFHGYRGNAERDLCGGVQRCFALGRNVLLVDQRASGKSDGRVITFGINESKDCELWVKYLIERFDKDQKIILTGISMGAATVLMASARSFPKNVVGVIADCGYSSAKDIIMKSIKEMHLPPKLLYPFIKFGAKVFGRFDLEETSPISSMRNCKLPVIFFHGEDDAFVPCEMSKLNYATCSNQKKLITMENAGHGLCYIVEPERYLEELKIFEKEIA